MNFALQKNSVLTVAKETTYGISPIMTDKGLAVELSGDVDLQNNYDNIERDIVRKSFSTYAPIRGTQNTSGSMSFELHGSGALNIAPETDVLWECAFGYKLAGATGGIVATADSVLDYETGTTPTGTTELFKIIITLVDASAFTVGRTVMIYSGTTIRGLGYVSEISSNTMTIISKTNFFSNIVANDSVTEGLVYSLKASDGTVDELPSFSANFYRGNITKESYVGNIVTSMKFNFQTGQIIVPEVSFEGKTVTYIPTTFEDDVTVGTLEYDSNTTSPLVARSVDMIAHRNDMLESWYMPVSSLNIDLTNEINKLQAVTEEGVFQIMRVKRNVSGQLETYYLNKEFQQAYLDEATYQVGVIAGDTIGNIFAFRMPKMKISSLSMSTDNGLYKYSANFSAEPVSGDDEFFVQVF